MLYSRNAIRAEMLYRRLVDDVIKIFVLLLTSTSFEDNMANFGLIDLNIGLYIKVNVNNGKTNVKSISQNI